MDGVYEKKWPNEKSSSSAILIDGPFHVQRAAAPIRHYFIFSLFSSICLCPATGLIALAYSLKSSAKADVNYHEKSRLYSRRALLWNLISVILAVFSLVLTLIFFYQLNETMKMYGNRMYQQRQPQPANDIDRLMQSIANNN